ncbi:MAG: porin [Rhodoferax sp.]
MKKTLVALAALAATGAFAQVTVTGAVAFGYTQTNSSGNGTLASGFGVDTAEVYFNAKEDLGGGMSADGKLGLSDISRGSAPTTTSVGAAAGGDFVLGLTTGAGRFQFSTAKGADYLSGGVSGVAGIGMDGKVFGARSVRDAVSYIVPVAGFTLTVSHQEAANKLGLGAGAAGSAADTVGQRLNVLGLGYASGALAANAQYLVYDNRTDGSALSSKDIVRASLSYDLGSVKLGAGYSQATQMNSATVKDALIGATIPMGALTMGVQWSQRKSDGGVTTATGTNVDGTYNGTGLTASYALSKRTSLQATYRVWDNQPAADKRNDEINLLVGHSF